MARQSHRFKLVRFNYFLRGAGRASSQCSLIESAIRVLVPCSCPITLASARRSQYPSQRGGRVTNLQSGAITGRAPHGIVATGDIQPPPVGPAIDHDGYVPLLLVC